MRKGIYTSAYLLVVLLLGIYTQAQGIRVGDNTPTVEQQTIGGYPGILQVAPNAKINFCTSPVNGVPCTNYATTYTDATLTVACSVLTQVTLYPTNTCSANSDSNGNWGVWVPPGNYAYTVTVGGQSFGPFSAIISVPNNSNVTNFCSSGGVCDGVTDDSTAFISLVNSMTSTGGGTIQLPSNKTILFNSQVIISGASNITVQGYGINSIIKCGSGTNGRCFQWQGVIGTRRQIAVAISQGATSFTLQNSGDGADLVAGEWLLINEFDAGAGPNIVTTDWAQVLSVVGTTVNVVNPFRTAFTTSRTYGATSGLGFNPITTLSSKLKFTDFLLQQASSVTSTGPVFYCAGGVDGFILRDVYSDNGKGNGVATNLCRNVDIDNFRQLNDGTQATEIASSVDVTIHDSHFAGSQYTTANPSINKTATFTMDNGTAYFRVHHNSMTGGGNFMALLYNSIHDGTFDSNDLGYVPLSGNTNGLPFGCIGCKRVQVYGNNVTGGAGPASAAFTFSDTSAFTVNVTSDSNFAWGNGVTGTVNLYALNGSLGTDAVVYNSLGTATYLGPLSAPVLNGTSTSASQGNFTGWSSKQGATGTAGQITLGNTSSNQGVIQFSTASNDGLFIDDTSNNGTSFIHFRLATATSPVDNLKISQTQILPNVPIVPVTSMCPTGATACQEKRVAGCTTAASIGGVCSTDITVTWNTAFADSSYSVSCFPDGSPTNLPGTPYVVAASKAAGSVHVNYFAITAAAASWTSIDCIALHD